MNVQAAGEDSFLGAAIGDELRRQVAAAQQAVLAPEASVVKIGGDIPVARVGHAMASRYNKPEALQHWLEAEGLAGTVQKVIFVDDNSDNAFSMF